MFRKTTAIAVLLLLVSSLFAGSVTIAPAKEQAGTNKEGYSGTFERLAPAAFTGIRGMLSEAYPSRVSGAGATHIIVANGTHVSGSSETGMLASGAPDAGFDSVVVINGVSVSGGLEPGMAADWAPDAGFGLPGPAEGGITPVTGMSVYGAHGAGYIVVLTNESSIEMTGPPTARFVFNSNMIGERLGSALTDVRSRMPGAGEASFAIHSPVLMYRQDGAAPERYDMKFESRHAFTGAPGEFGNFTGHLAIPWDNGSGLIYGPAGPIAFAGGTIELNGSMTVDMANVTLASDTATTTDLYNNAISGGQTNWHQVDLSTAVSSFNVDLKWQNVNDSLRLLLYSPDGKILGPYYDNADGKTDGRINLNIANPSGVASGEWHLKVTDMATLGNDNYYVKTY